MECVLNRAKIKFEVLYLFRASKYNPILFEWEGVAWKCPKSFCCVVELTLSIPTRVEERSIWAVVIGLRNVHVLPLGIADRS